MSAVFFWKHFKQIDMQILRVSPCPLFRITTHAHQKVYCVGCTSKKLNLKGKLVRVVRGEVYDVAVDIRSGSPTYGQWEAVILSEENKTQFWVPPGFAHGFVVLSETADFEYKCTDYYDPSDEGSLLWNDPDLNIPWPIDNPKLSEKDANAPLLADLKK